MIVAGDGKAIRVTVLRLNDMLIADHVKRMEEEEEWQARMNVQRQPAEQ